jgi:hypothetical protein
MKNVNQFPNETTVIKVNSNELSKLGWVFEFDFTEKVESEFIEEFPVTYLHVQKGEEINYGVFVGMTFWENNESDPFPTENPGDDYSRTVSDIDFLLEKGLAEIVEGY